MTRVSWFDEKTHMPVIDEQVHKLSSFVDAMADGVIDDIRTVLGENRFLKEWQTGEQLSTAASELLIFTYPTI